MTDLDAFRGRGAILFDLDGTLYARSDYPGYFDEVDRITGRRVQSAYGASDPGEAFRCLVRDQAQRGLGSKSETLRHVHGIGLAEMNRWREQWTRPEDHLRPDPRLAATLAALAPRFRLLVGTNNAPGLARRTLASLGIGSGVFDLVLTSEDLEAAKPDAGFFEGIARRCGLGCASIVSVGDMEHQDIVPARRLGMGACLVGAMDDVYRLAAAQP